MHFEIDFLESHDEESLKGELQRVARVLGKSKLTSKEIDRVGRVSSRTLMQRFGSLRKALEAAGLTPSRYTLATDEELMQEVARVWATTQRERCRLPRFSDMTKPASPVSASTVVRRFGTWKKALIATSKWMALPPAKRNLPGRGAAERRKTLSDRKRFLVLKRDRYRCQKCRKSGVELEVDHILPVCKGGSDMLENLQTLCKPCNRGKGGDLE